MYRFRLLMAALLIATAAPAIAQPFVYVAADAPLFSDRGGVWVIEGKTLDIVGGIGLPKDHFATSIALGLNDRRAYISTFAKSSAGGTLTVADTLTNTIVVSLALEGSARGVALSKDHQRVFVSHDPSSVSVFSTTNHALIAQIAVGEFPTDLVLSPDGETMYVGQLDGVSAVSTSRLSVTAQISTGFTANRLGVSPSGHEVYVSNVRRGFSIITTATGAVQSVPLTFQGLPFPTAVVVSRDGSKVFVGNSSLDPFPQTGRVEIFDTTTRTFTGIAPVDRALDGALDLATNEAYFVAKIGRFQVGQLSVLDNTTNKLTRSLPLGGPHVVDGAIALGNPAGCAFRLAPTLTHFGPSGGSGTIDVRAPAGCAWNLTASEPWLTFTSTTSGTGPGTVSYSVGPGAAAARFASVTVSGPNVMTQSVEVRQTVPYTWIDEPVTGTTVAQPFTLRGWAIVQTTAPADNGVESIEITAQSVAGGAPIRLGIATRVHRADITAAFGTSSYSNAGFTFQVNRLPPGTYIFSANARSALTGETDTRSVTVTVTTPSQPAGFVEAPRDNDEVTQPFLVAGWAADISRSSGTGVDAVNVYAYPESGGAPIFLGSAQYGNWPRGDVGSYYNDSAMNGSGFLLLAQGLALGRYRIVAFAHSTVTGEFFARSVTVNVIGSSEAIMQIDIAQTPKLADGTCCAVRLLGWAVDRRATSGTGIAAVNVWAYPEQGGAPIFLFGASPDIDRDVTTILFGSRFARAGFDGTSAKLAPGTYRVVAFALSHVTGKFDAVRVVRVVIP